MRLTLKIRKPRDVRRLQLLIGSAVGMMICLSRLSAQEPLDAPRPSLESTPREVIRRHAAEPEQELEPVDPDSARIPKSWFKNIPVKPTGILIQDEDVPAFLRILAHVREVPPANLSEADREFRLEMIERFGERKREEIPLKIKDETQQKLLLKELDKRLSNYREDPFSYPLVHDAFNLAEACQGQVVSFSGHVRRVRKFPAGENEYGFDQLYEIWLFDAESNGYPVIIVCSEVPPKLPIEFPDTEVIDGVSARGYYFKLYAYEGEEKYHVIPMILAKSIDWNPPADVSRKFPPWAYAVAILLGFVALWLIIRSNRSRKPVRNVRELEENPFQSS